MGFCLSEPKSSQLKKSVCIEFNTRVSQFELNYWNKLTFPWHSNLLRCICIHMDMKRNTSSQRRDYNALLKILRWCVLKFKVFLYKGVIKTFYFCDWQIVIHLGIAPGAKYITLEQTGKNHCYTDRDVSGLCPYNHSCIEGGPERLDSIIDMRSLSKQLKSMGLDVIYSRDAGR